jgi:membrane protein DedA with SNARE-associated domain
MSYKRFAAMIATSTVVMFGLMYSTAYRLDHVWWSQTRFWMALFMGAAMAVVMLGYERCREVRDPARVRAKLCVVHRGSPLTGRLS